MKTKELKKMVGVFMSTLLLMSMCIFMSCGDDDEVSPEEVMDFYWKVEMVNKGELTASDERYIVRFLEDTYADYEDDVKGVKVNDALYVHEKLIKRMKDRFLDEMTILKSQGTIIFTVSLITERDETVKKNTFTVEYENCTVK